MDQIFAVSVTGCTVRLQSIRLCYDLRDRIRPIRFEIRFERKKNDSQVPTLNTPEVVCMSDF